MAANGTQVVLITVLHEPLALIMVTCHIVKLIESEILNNLKSSKISKNNTTVFFVSNE